MRTRLVSLVLLSIMLVAAGCRSLPDATRLPEPTATGAGSGSTPLPVSQPTATSQPATASPAPGVTPTLQPTNSKPADADVDAAVQVILDYWGAVNQRDYARAYRYWAEDGQASGQSLEQFTNGFANTVQVTVQIGSLEQGNARQPTVTLPVTLAAVSNVPNSPSGEQRVQHFRGTYTLQPQNPSTPAGGEWRIASAAITDISGSVEALGEPTAVRDPAKLVWSYFAAINHRDFGHAFTYWANLGQASGQTFAQFHQGFATTRQVAIQLGTAREEGAAGSTYASIPIIIVATQSDGTTQTYCGTYTLRRLNVPPFNQFGWRIESASIVAGASAQLGSAEAEKLLTGGCESSAK